MIKKIYRTLRGKLFRVATLISPKLNVYLTYWQKFRKLPNFKSPKTFQEKLLYLKLYNYIDNPRVIQCADKIRVREYVEEKGYGYLLNDIIGIYDSVEEIPWEELPNQFALKWNFGATYNIICDDKSKINIEAAKAKLKKWGKTKYWLPYAEMQYAKCSKKMLCEKYLDTSQGFLPYDYKLYCFNGEVKAILFIMDRDQEKKGGFFTPDWEYIGLPGSEYKDFKELPEKPYSLDTMLECATVLSKEFPFVRVDFYQCGKRAIFGEMTFTPAAGLYVSQIDINGVSMGDMLNLESLVK